MPNVERALKAEIARISRKEIKTAIGQIGKSHIGLKKTVADLKKRLASLEKENKRLVAEARRQKRGIVEKPPEEQGKVRLTSKSIRTLRSRLRLTQADFAKLVGATTHAVYLWEKKEGALRLRDKTKIAFLSVRGLGAREAKAKLDEAAGKLKKIREAASKKKKRPSRLGSLFNCPLKIGASKNIVRPPFTLKGVKSFFNEGENIKEEVGYAREIT
jgi:DNA-binding transcriptional regulator YiaG